MSELEEKLENILGNPQAMAQIMSLAQSLNQNGQPARAGDGTQAQPQPTVSATAQPPPASAGDEGGLGSLLGGLDPNMLSAAAGLLGQFNSGDDDRRVALLTALRPFVKEQRYARLDKAIQIARLSRLIRSGLDLFRTRKENSQGGDSPREEGGHV